MFKAFEFDFCKEKTCAIDVKFKYKWSLKSSNARIHVDPVTILISCHVGFYLQSSIQYKLWPK